jgi:hypothetical protein
MQRLQTPRKFLLGTSLFLILFSACASLGTPEDQDQGAVLWGEMDGYEAWASFAGHEGMELGLGPHGKFVTTTINDVAAADPAALAPGSIVVKGNYATEDPSSLEALTVMKIIPGYDPENGDWYWARYTPKGEMTHAGKVSMCIDCHFDADGEDFIFLND